jgi:predicted glutamine amidotransferase
MCKIFAMTNTSDFKINAKFINAVKYQVCKTSDKDGFGWAAMDNLGNVGGERTIRPWNFKPLDQAKEKVVSKLPIVLKAHNSFGKTNLSKSKAFVGHGRLSTNDISLENTHPFFNGTTAMIHNGVVRDRLDKWKDLKTTNDTEILYNYWLENGIKAVENGVGGYYAFVTLEPDGTMHVVRDSQAMLYVSYCFTVNSYIFATTADIIIGVAKSMKWKCEAPEEMLPNTYAIFDGNTLADYSEFNGSKVTDYEDLPGGDYNDWRQYAYDNSGDYNKKSNLSVVDVMKNYKEVSPESAPVPTHKEYREVDYIEDNELDEYEDIVKDELVEGLMDDPRDVFDRMKRIA